MVLPMRRIMFAAALVAAAAAAPGAAAERRFTVTDFDRILVDGPFQVTLSTGRSGSAVATGSSQAIDRVSIEVEGRTLRVRPNRSSWGGYPGEGSGALSIKVTTHELRGAAVTGSGSIAIDKAKGMRFDISLAGNGSIGIANLETDKLGVGLLGSGKIRIAGKAKELRATIKGSGDLDAEKLLVEDADIKADTAGNIAVGVRRAAKITATGQGDTRIVGKPACAVKGLTSGRVSCGT